MTQPKPKPQIPVQGSTGETEADKEENTRLPHERDEASDSGFVGTDRGTDPPQSEIPQAHEDVERGLVDTDRRGVPADVPPRRRNRAP
jgi:hypothetical protein